MSSLPEELLGNNLNRAAEGLETRCPDCGGPMHQVDDPRVLRFRCHEGHAYTAGSLFAAQTEQNRNTANQSAALTNMKETPKNQ